MLSREAGSVCGHGLLLLPEKLPVHGNEQLLPVVPETHVASDGFDHVQACLVLARRDRQIAKRPRQRSGIQVECALQCRHLGRNGQRSPTLPLRDRRMAYPNGLGEFPLREPALLTVPSKQASELLPLHRSQAAHLTESSEPVDAKRIAQSTEQLGMTVLQYGSGDCHTGSNALVCCGVSADFGGEQHD